MLCRPPSSPLGLLFGRFTLLPAFLSLGRVHKLLDALLLDQWQSATLDSKDAFAPLITLSDDPDLEFTVNIGFRATVVVPP